MICSNLVKHVSEFVCVCVLVRNLVLGCAGAILELYSNQNRPSPDPSVCVCKVCGFASWCPNIFNIVLIKQMHGASEHNRLSSYSGSAATRVSKACKE